MGLSLKGELLAVNGVVSDTGVTLVAEQLDQVRNVREKERTPVDRNVRVLGPRAVIELCGL